MDVLAFNGSPRMEKGNTHLLLAPLLKGMQDSGAEVDLHYTSKLTIKPCLGDLSCVFRTPGKCVQDDDINAISPKVRSADILVLATPLYVFGISGPIKNLLDRLVVQMSNPLFTIREGQSFHPPRDGEKTHKIVLVSTCGMWEVSKFDPVIEQMRTTAESLGQFEFAGALLRPHAEVMKGMMRAGISLEDTFGAAYEAGQQLVQTGTMDARTVATVSREIIPLDDFVRTSNHYIKGMLPSKEG